VPDGQNAIAALASGPNGSVQMPERQTGLFNKNAAHFGEFHVLLVCANEQMKFMQGFDLIYLFAESRLGDVQSVGGPSEVQLFGQDNHGVQVTYFNPGEHFSSSLPHRQRLVNALHLVKEPAVREKYQKKKFIFSNRPKGPLDKEIA
jgi:hypothetical protein